MSVCFLPTQDCVTSTKVLTQPSVLTIENIVREPVLYVNTFLCPDCMALPRNSCKGTLETPCWVWSECRPRPYYSFCNSHETSAMNRHNCTLTTCPILHQVFKNTSSQLITKQPTIFYLCNQTLISRENILLRRPLKKNIYTPQNRNKTGIAPVFGMQV